MTFAEFQTALQRAIMEGDDSILGLIPDGAKEEKGVLLGVYRNAYVLRLIEVIESDHELLHAYLGDEAFDEMARAYVTAHPSDQPNARWFSRHLPAFLARAAPYRDEPHLAELALLEKTLADAFDAPDAPVAGVATLAAIAPEAWGGLKFSAHPSAMRLDFHTNASGIWAALKAEAEPPYPARNETVEQLLAWRSDTTPMFRPLGPEEAMMWAEAVKGARFGVLCEMLATYDDPDNAAMRAAQYLAGWLNAGLISRAALGVPAPRGKKRASSRAL